MGCHQVYRKRLSDETATIQFATQFAAVLKNGMVIFLHGSLGAGKTTFSRGVIQALGHKGNVKSPTYTLVEPYALADKTVYHFDLYRLTDPEELEFMGARDYFNADSLCLVEWPEQGKGYLPQPDLDIWLHYDAEHRIIEINPQTPTGEILVSALKNDETIQ